MPETSEIDSAVNQVLQRSRRVSAEAAFRAGLEQRLRTIELQIDELKSRLNGLLFFIASTVVAQVLLRLFV